MMSDAKDCPVCCFPYTDYTRKPIPCNICEYAACTKCVKKVMLSDYKDPHCMNCNVAWSREFIDQKLSKAFRTSELKKHRENVLLDREKSMLPATMYLVEAELEKRKILREVDDLYKEKNKLYDKIREIDDLIYEKHRMINRQKKKKDSNPVYQRPCPSSDCRGYIHNWRCKICEIKVCSKCLGILQNDTSETEHVCKEDDIATAKLLEKDTRNCPNQGCRAPIFKISGCSQMFCTKCHTAFDWETGTIITNQASIHNPHYYDYLRQTHNGAIPRNVGDLPCGGMPTIYNVITYMKEKKVSGNTQNIVLACHRGLQHFVHFEIPRHPINLVGGDIFENLRLKYLLNEISEDDWKRELQRIEKKNERNIAFRQVFDMIIAVGIDMFNRVVACNNEEGILRITSEMETLRKYFNDAVLEVYRRFASGGKPKGLDISWVYTYVHESNIQS